MAFRRRSVRTVGAVIVNPRGRKSRGRGRKGRRSNGRRRTRRNTSYRVLGNGRKSRKGRKSRRRSNGRRRPAARRRRSNGRRRTSARRGYRRNKGGRPKHRARAAKLSRIKGKWHKARPPAKRAKPRRGYVFNGRKRRSAPRVMRRNSRHGRRYARKGYRRNGMLGGLAGMLKKIPVLGPLLAPLAGFGPIAALGALAVEIPIQASAFVASQEWIPEWAKGDLAYYAILGAGLGLAAKKFAPSALGSKDDVALAVTAATWGAGYHAWRTKMMANAAGIATADQQAAGGEAGVKGLGALVQAYNGMGGGGYGQIGVDYSGMGMGPAYTVGPQGYGGLSAVIVGG